MSGRGKKELTTHILQQDFEEYFVKVRFSGPYRETIMIKFLIISARPAQWIKNTFVLAPLIFSQSLFILTDTIKAFSTFILFCVTASAVYLINDVFDLEKDRAHLVKVTRPIASGELKATTAVVTAIILFICAITPAFYLDKYLGAILLSYFLLNLGYSKFLKDVVILDVFLIAIGFIMRIFAGSVIIDIAPSSWLLACTLLISLFLGFCKRRHELVTLNNEAKKHRTVLEHYSPIFLDQMISVVTAATVISYVLYTTSSETIAKFGNRNLIYTTPFVLYGIFRYLYLIYHRNLGGNPTSLVLTDKPMLINLGLWLMAILYILYAKNLF